jgi:hypothetical protein
MHIYMACHIMLIDILKISHSNVIGEIYQPVAKIVKV